MTWLLPAGIFLVAFGTRVAVAAIAPYQDWGGEMQNVARTLATTGEFADAFGKDTGPTSHVAPVYPAILAILYRFFGTEARWPARLLAIVLTALTAAMMPALARRAQMSKGSGLVAAFLYALAPSYMVEIDGTWEQPLVGLCIVILAFASLEGIDYGWVRGRDVVRYGFIAGFSLLVSPSMLLAVALIPLQGLFRLRGHDARLRLRSLSVMAAICASCLTPWLIFNSWRMGGFVPIRSNFGLELYLGNRDEADGTQMDKDDPGFPHPFTNRKEREKVRQMGELAYMREKQRAAARWISQHPTEFLRLTAKRILNFWFPGANVCLQSKPAIGMIISAYLRTVTSLAFLGLIRMWKQRGQYAWMWTALLLGPSIPYSIAHALIRYREPIQAIVLLLACEFAFAVFMGIRATGRLHVAGGPVKYF